jgi:hypothetical protein
MASMAMAAALIVLLSAPLRAGDEPPSEKWYTERWCALSGGQVWFRMADGGRCDCLTPSHAVEVAPAREWADAIGWSLRSGYQTGRRPGIVLIQEGAADSVHKRRLEAVIDRYSLPITVWTTSRGVPAVD